MYINYYYKMEILETTLMCVNYLYSTKYLISYYNVQTTLKKKINKNLNINRQRTRFQNI